MIWSFLANNYVVTERWDRRDWTRPRTDHTSQKYTRRVPSLTRDTSIRNPWEWLVSCHSDPRSHPVPSIFTPTDSYSHSFSHPVGPVQLGGMWRIENRRRDRAEPGLRRDGGGDKGENYEYEPRIRERQGEWQ